MRLFDDVLPTAQYDATDLVNYPHGRVKNDTSLGAKDGTPIAEKTWGDIYNGIVELLRLAGITSSGVAEKKGASDLADAVGFLKPIAVLKLGGGGIGEAAVLNSSAVTGYTFKYVAGSYSSVTYKATNKLTILKDLAASTENFIVHVTPVLTVGAAGLNIVAAKHGALDSGSYFANDSENIEINVASDNEAVAMRTNMIATIYKV